MEMENVNSDVFGLLVHWLYTLTAEFDKAQEAVDRVANLLPLARLWTLADVCLTPALQNGRDTHPPTSDMRRFQGSKRILGICLRNRREYPAEEDDCG